MARRTICSWRQARTTMRLTWLAVRALTAKEPIDVVVEPVELLEDQVPRLHQNALHFQHLAPLLLVPMKTILVFHDHLFVTLNPVLIPDKLTCGPSAEPVEPHTEFLEFLPDPSDSFLRCHFASPGSG